MSIEFRYYMAGRDGFYESPGKMILSRRIGFFPGSSNKNAEESEFSYTPVKTWVEIREDHNKRVKHPVNFLFIERNYKVGQREIVAHLSWMQRQKLRWMYQDHWLQRPGNLLHATVILLVISIFVTGIFYLELTGFF